MDRSCFWIDGECVSVLPASRAPGSETDLNRLSVFFVALADWVVFGLSPSIATYAGGLMILIAFGLLTKHTLGEKTKK